MTLEYFLDNVTWDELKQSGSSHYKSGDIEQVDLFKSLGTVPYWAWLGAMRRATRNIQAIREGRQVEVRDIKKVIHELMFLYVEIRDSQTKQKESITRIVGA